MAYETIKPGESRVFSHDWIDVAGSPAVVSSVAHSITPTDGSPAPTAEDAGTDGTETFVRVSGCEAGNVYRVESAMIDGDGERHIHSFTLRCDP